MANILWMDNDRTFLMPFVLRLEAANHNVVRVESVFEAEYLLTHPNESLGTSSSWDLVLIDIMMNVRRRDVKDQRYSREATEKGHRTGVVFFEYNKDIIHQQKAKVAALSMRNDQKVRDELVALGFPSGNIMHKMKVSDTRDFEAWVKKMLDQGGD